MPDDAKKRFPHRHWDKRLLHRHPRRRKGIFHTHSGRPRRRRRRSTVEETFTPEPVTPVEVPAHARAWEAPQTQRAPIVADPPPAASGDLPPRTRSRRRHHRHHHRRHRERRGVGRWIKRAAVGVGVFVGAAVALAVPSVLIATSPALDGQRALQRAREAFESEDPVAARAAFTQADDAFDRAEWWLGSPLTWPVRAVPVLGRQFRTAHALAAGGLFGSRAGLKLVDAYEQRPDGGWAIDEGTFDLRALVAAGSHAQEAVPLADEAADRVARSPASLLLPPLAAARTDALELLDPAARGLRRGVAALDAAPGLLGGRGHRRYVIAFTNLSELRGSGGFVGNFAVLDADGGRLDLVGGAGQPSDDLPEPSDAALSPPGWYSDAYGRYGGTAIWQNLNMSIDFPTVGSLMVDAIEDSSIGPADGVIQVDPVGLEAFLGLTGPVDVPPWPEPISARNVSRVTQHDAYTFFEGRSDDRYDFLGDVVEIVFDTVLDRQLELGPELLRAVGGAVDGGHLQMYVSDAEGQAGLVDAGLARPVERTQSATDVLGLVTQNSGGNKADWFLRRSIAYSVDLDPQAGTAHTRLEAVLRNETPTEGLPEEIIESFRRDLPPGSNRQLVVVHRSPVDELESLTIDGSVPEDIAPEREGPLTAYHVLTVIPSLGETPIVLDSVVEDAIEGTGRHRVYRLHVLRQPVVNADEFELDVDVPEGWEVAGQTSFSGPLEHDLVIEVEIVRPLGSWAYDVAIREPWSTLRRLIERLF